MASYKVELSESVSHTEDAHDAQAKLFAMLQRIKTPITKRKYDSTGGVDAHEAALIHQLNTFSFFVEIKKAGFNLNVLLLDLMVSYVENACRVDLSKFPPGTESPVISEAHATPSGNGGWVVNQNITWGGRTISTTQFCEALFNIIHTGVV